MEFNQIRYFLMTTETLNFTRAAERCNVSQPALTRAIQKLEDELGGPLFRRERNRTHLTELGQVMREHLKHVDKTTQAAKIAASKLLNLEKAALNVGIMCTIGHAYIVSFLAEFQLHHPGIEMTIFDVTPTNMTDGLLAGDLDCALLGLPMALHERFDTTKLYEENMVAIFPPGHRYRTMKSVPLAELEGEKYLDRLNCEFRDSFFNLLAERGVEVSVCYRSEREDWIQNMVLQGMGVCIIPEYSVTVEGLTCKPVAEPKIKRSVELVTVAGHRRSPAVQAFINKATGHIWPNS